MIDDIYQMSQDARTCSRYVALQRYLLNGGIDDGIISSLKGIQFDYFA